LAALSQTVRTACSICAVGGKIFSSCARAKPDAMPLLARIPNANPRTMEPFFLLLLVPLDYMARVRTMWLTRGKAEIVGA
jgi:hypothetical protein